MVKKIGLWEMCVSHYLKFTPNKKVKINLSNCKNAKQNHLSSRQTFEHPLC